MIRRIATRDFAELVFLITVVPGLLCTGCDRHVVEFSKPSPIESLAVSNLRRDPLAKTRIRGRDVYMHYCKICHGATGMGDGFNSASLEVAPRDFSGSEFWQASTDQRLLLAVSQGGRAIGKSVLMPAWGHTLSRQELDDVVAYLHTLASQNDGAMQPDE